MFLPPREIAKRSGCRRNESPCVQRSLSVLIIVPMLLMVSGCVQEMANQPRVDTLEPDKFDPPGSPPRQPPSGTVARGSDWESNPFTTGMEAGEPVAKIPVDVTEDLLRRGQERYGIFCQHCHGPTGFGNGMVVQRGFPPPPSYHIERLETAPDGKIFQTITEGLGRMPALGRRITPEDRWAITAYVRALQVSQGTKVDQLPETDRSQFQ